MAKDNEMILTPMMKQYFELKAKHPDAIMLFRCGDFYETYSEDAVTASEILGITLTKRWLDFLTMRSTLICLN